MQIAESLEIAKQWHNSAGVWFARRVRALAWHYQVFEQLPIEKLGCNTGRVRVGKPDTSPAPADTAPVPGLHRTRPVVRAVLCENRGSMNTRGFRALWEAERTSRTSGTRQSTWPIPLATTRRSSHTAVFHCCRRPCHDIATGPASAGTASISSCSSVVVGRRAGEPTGTSSV